MAFLALWFFNLGTTLYFAYRFPKLSEDFADEKRRAEANNERVFFLALCCIFVGFSVLSLLSTFSGSMLYIAFLLVLTSIILFTAVIFYHTFKVW